MKKLREERDGTVHMLEIENMHKSRELEQAESAIAINDVTIEEYKEALKIAAAGEVEKMRDELECMREELEEAKRDRELAINFAGGAADDVAKAAAEGRGGGAKAAAAREREGQRGARRATHRSTSRFLNIRVRDADGRGDVLQDQEDDEDAQGGSTPGVHAGPPTTTTYRFLFDGQRVDGEQTAEDIDMARARDQIDCVSELLTSRSSGLRNDSTRPLTIPATSTVADLRTALGNRRRAALRLVGRLLDDDPARSSSASRAAARIASGAIIAPGATRQRPARSRLIAAGADICAQVRRTHPPVHGLFIAEVQARARRRGALPKRASTPGSTQRTSGTSQHTRTTIELLRRRGRLRRRRRRARRHELRRRDRRARVVVPRVRVRHGESGRDYRPRTTGKSTSPRRARRRHSSDPQPTERRRRRSWLSQRARGCASRFTLAAPVEDVGERGDKQLVAHGHAIWRPRSPRPSRRLLTPPPSCGSSCAVLRTRPPLLSKAVPPPTTSPEKRRGSRASAPVSTSTTRAHGVGPRRARGAACAARGPLRAS